jgi:hypothetical protein
LAGCFLVLAALPAAFFPLAIPADAAAVPSG